MTSLPLAPDLWQGQPLPSPLSPDEQHRVLRDRHTKGAGHSPALKGLLAELRCTAPRQVKDLCFLTNPYAGDLVFEYMCRDFVAEPQNLRDLTEAYPSQNPFIAAKLAAALGNPAIKADNLLIGNGTIELIQFFVQALGLKKILVPIPSFSTYYEVDPATTEVVTLPLSADENFQFNPSALVSEAARCGADAVVWINPHNPTGTFIPKDQLAQAFSQLSHLKAIFCDESFLHFASPGDDLWATSLAEYPQDLPNLIVMKSLAKDFGAAGLRVGYGIMATERRDWALAKGFLWNSNGFAEWFYELMGETSFQRRYLDCRRRYLDAIASFAAKAKKLPGLKTFPTKGNFILAQVAQGQTGYELMERLLLEHSLYIRDCGTKIGLDARYVRMAVGRSEDEEAVLAALAAALTK